MDKIVLELAKKFKREFGKNLLSVSVHGSVAQEDTHLESDIDYFLVFSEINYNILRKLKNLKQLYEKENSVELSLNIQKKEELPIIRNNAFYHKNRYALFLHEATKIDKTLIGEDPYRVSKLPSKQEIRLEAVRIVNSFAYFLRKFIVNSNIDHAVKEAVRYVIMSTQYANAFIGDYPLTTRESVYSFERNFKNFSKSTTPRKFFQIKRGETTIDNKEILLDEAISFLEDLDELLFKKFN